MNEVKVLLGTPKIDKDVFWATYGAEFYDPAPVVLVGDERIIFASPLEITRLMEHGAAHGLTVKSWTDYSRKGEELLEASGVDVNRSMALKALHAFFKECGITECAVPYKGYAGLAETLRTVGYTVHVMTDVAVPFLPGRAVKTRSEVDAIKASIAVTEEAIGIAASMLRDAEIATDRALVLNGEPLTSERVREAMHVFFASKDHDVPDSTCIAGGEQGADPHELGSGPLYANEFIVMDVFPQSRKTSYFADVTRTFLKGTPTDAQRAMYDAVAQATAVATLLAKPGMTGQELHEAAKHVLEQRGFPTDDTGEVPFGFMHALGHGLGLDMHELPKVSDLADTPLVVGNVFTIEPGLYYVEGQHESGVTGGVRIEDDVVLIEDGCENLCSFPKDQWIIP